MSTTELHDPTALAEQLGAVERLLVVLDFDGVLAPIVEHPDDAAMAPGARAAITSLCERTAVAVLTGRPVDDVLPRLQSLPVTIVGGHGTEVRTADDTRTALVDSAELRATIDEVEGELRGLVDEDAGWVVERKPTSIALHHRRVAHDEADRLLPRARTLMAAHVDDPPGWVLLDGKAVTELRPDGVDKGTALRWLADRHPGRTVLVLGDDVTDEDSFVVAGELDGTAVLVSEDDRTTAAGTRIADPGAVVAFLAALAG